MDDAVRVILNDLTKFDIQYALDYHCSSFGQASANDGMEWPAVYMKILHSA